MTSGSIISSFPEAASSPLPGIDRVSRPGSGTRDTTGWKVGECRDNTLQKGAIGIQVHGGDGFTEMAIHIKKMEIRTLGENDQPTPPAATK